jgi:hypothetical protein
MVWINIGLQAAILKPSKTDNCHPETYYEIAAQGWNEQKQQLKLYSISRGGEHEGEWEWESASFKSEWDSSHHTVTQA